MPTGQQSGRAVAIDNLLLNCAKMRAGTTILFVNENGTEAVSRDTVEAIEARARELGGSVTSLWLDHVPGPEDMPQSVLDAVAASDVAVFTHNMGGLLRLRPVPGNGLVVHNYVGTDAMLDSPWSRVPYGLWEKISGIIAREFAASHTWRIRDDRGTDVTGTIPEAERAAPAQATASPSRRSPSARTARPARIPRTARSRSNGLSVHPTTMWATVSALRSA